MVVVGGVDLPDVALVVCCFLVLALVVQAIVVQAAVLRLVSSVDS